MAQPQRREFDCTVYPAGGIDAYPRDAELYISVTVAFIVYDDGRVRELSTGENQHVQSYIDELEPDREDTVELILHENTFYTADESVDSAEIHDKYLVDGETVMRIKSKSGYAVDPGPIEGISNETFMQDHEDVYVVERDSPFTRFQFPAGDVKRFVKSDRVAKLDPV